MTYPDSVKFLYSLGNEVKTVKLGLDRIQILLAALDNPHERTRFVHVAGTNGKGSTCAMIEAGLRAAGLRTGLYISPHLVEPTERIQINNQPVPEQEFIDAFDRVHRIAERLIAAGELEFHPTYFETVTAMAFLLFEKHRAEIVVLEVGLGGRLDATNVVTPILSVITPVDFDHEAWLGSSIQQIASEKAGIIKYEVPVVISQTRAEAREVIFRQALAMQATPHLVERYSIEDISIDAWGSRFSLEGIPVECPLPGRHQVDNARTAAVALRVLGIDPFFIQHGISGVRWPGRLERVRTNPDVVLDGAHNPLGARALAEYIGRFHGGKRIGMIFGIMRDKSVEEIGGILFPQVQDLIFTAPGQPRAFRPEALVKVSGRADARCAPNLRAALAMPSDCDIRFITGSLYLVGEARALLVQ